MAYGFVNLVDLVVLLALYEHALHTELLELLVLVGAAAWLLLFNDITLDCAAILIDTLGVVCVDIGVFVVVVC